MLLGTGAVFAALVPLIPTTAVYYCEHNTLYTGGAPESYAQSLGELARLYAEAIKQACCRAGAVASGQPSVDPLDHLTGAVPGAHGEGCFDLIGGSWGGYMAHQIALVAQQIGAPCRRLVLLDPNPPTVGRAPSLAPSTAREAVHALLATMLDAAAAGAQDGAQDGAQVGVQGSARDGARLGARYGAWRQPPEGDDGGGGVRSTFDALADEIAIWPDAELIPRAAQRLVGAGLMADTIEAVVALGRRVLVYQHQDLMMRQHLARAFEEGTPLPQLDCPTLLVLATTRADFFERAFALGTTRETAGMERAREFGAVRRELVLEGTHQSVVQRCATGTERRFVHALLEFLAASGFEA
jgi:pimeloyl-ACP methyl ester carboxylesterase